MIENPYNFTELDNDFLTLWGRWLLGKSFSSLLEDIQKLAELGQPNACATYYKIMKRGAKTNPVIDKVVDEFETLEYDKILAKAQKFAQKNANDYEKFQQLTKKAECLCSTKQSELLIAENTTPLFLPSQYKIKCDRINNLYDPKIKEITNEIYSFRFSQLFNMAKKECLNQFHSTNNLLYYKRYLEIVCLYTPFAYTYSIENNIFIEVDNTILNMDKETKKTLKMLFKQLKENPSDPQLMSNVGDLCLNYEKATKKQKQLGLKINSALANRKYSKTMQDYSLKGNEKMEIRELSDSI